MANIKVTILGRQFPIQCKDGDEEKVIAISKKLDERLKSLKGKLQATNDTTIFALGSLIILDELETSKQTNVELKNSLDATQNELLNTNQINPENNVDDETLKSLENVAILLESIAEKVETV